MSETNGNEVEALSEQGFAHLQQGEYQAALEVAQQLEELRYSAAFEIAAQAHAGMGDLEAAVATLERGVELAPMCWGNWQLLGSYRSDLGRFDDAAVAYEQALACPNVWADSVRLNQAILAGRRADYKAALSHLDKVQDSRLALRVASSRIQVLQGMERLDEAASLAKKCLDQEWDSDSAGDDLARIAAVLGRIRLVRGRPVGDVRRFAFDALAHHANSSELLALIRDLDARYSPKAQYHRILVDVRVSEDDPLHSEAGGYLVSYDVVADTVADALQMIREFEDVAASDTLSVMESEVLEPRPQEPMGVYWRSGRMYYAEEGEE